LKFHQRESGIALTAELEARVSKQTGQDFVV